MWRLAGKSTALTQWKSVVRKNFKSFRGNGSVFVPISPIGAKNRHGSSPFLSKIHFFNLLPKSCIIFFSLSNIITNCWVYLPTEEKIRKPAAIVRHPTYFIAVVTIMMMWSV